MSPTATTTTAPMRTMQGIAVPASSVRPQEFFAKTRRHILTEKTVTFDGTQAQSTVELRKADILSTIMIRFVGTLTVALAAGTCATTRQWPYNLIKRAQFAANGASNLANCSGLFLKAREIMKDSDLTDRGVSRAIGAANVTQGTLSGAAENWGVGSGTAAIADGAYPVDLTWIVPVAEDEVDLAGAVFLQTSSSDLTLQLQFGGNSELFTLTGAATAALAGTFTFETTKFSIPIGGDGQIIVPDLSVFHSMIQSRAVDLAVGENEHRIIGQGAGKQLLRIIGQVWNDAPGVPLAVTAANYGRLGWRYGNNENPDTFLDGTHMRHDCERRYNTDLGAVWGLWAHDFAHENTFRDSVDMGTTSDLRLVTTIQNGVVLATPALEYVTETVFGAGQAA